MGSRAVFLDRDGTINEIVYFPELGVLDSPLKPEQFRLLPGSGEAIALLNRLGLKVVLASNQPAVAKGKTTMRLFESTTRKMHTLLKEKGARLDAEYYCFHHPQAVLLEYRAICDCRKPKPGLILNAAKDLGLDLAASYMVGDGISDVQAGRAAGCKTIMIAQPKCDLCRALEESGRPDAMVPDLLRAAKMIEQELLGQEAGPVAAAAQWGPGRSKDCR